MILHAHHFKSLTFALLIGFSQKVAAQTLVYRRNVVSGGTDIYEQSGSNGAVGRISTNAFGEVVVEDLRPKSSPYQQGPSPTASPSPFTARVYSPQQQLYTPNWEFLHQVMEASSRRSPPVQRPEATPAHSQTSAAEASSNERPSTVLAAPPKETDFEKNFKAETIRYENARKARVLALSHQAAQFVQFYNAYVNKPATVKNGWHKVVRITTENDGQRVVRFGYANVVNNAPCRYLEAQFEAAGLLDLSKSLVKKPITKCRGFVLNAKLHGVPEEIIFMDYLISPKVGTVLSFGALKVMIPEDGVITAADTRNEDIGAFKLGFGSPVHTGEYLLQSGRYTFECYNFSENSTETRPKTGSFQVQSGKTTTLDFR